MQDALFGFRGSPARSSILTSATRASGKNDDKKRQECPHRPHGTFCDFDRRSTLILRFSGRRVRASLRNDLGSPRFPRIGGPARLRVRHAAVQSLYERHALMAIAGSGRARCSELLRRLPGRRVRRLTAHEKLTPHPHGHCSADVSQTAPKDRRVSSRPSASVTFGRQPKLRSAHAESMELRCCSPGFAGPSLAGSSLPDLLRSSS